MSRWTSTNTRIDNPNTCCGCSGGRTADAPPLGGEPLGPPAPKPAVVDAPFDLTAPGGLSSAQTLPGDNAAVAPAEQMPDTTPPSLEVISDPAPWTAVAEQPSFTWPAAADAQSGLAGYRVYWGPDENGTADTLVTEAGYTPALPNLSSGAAAYYLRVAPLDKAGNLGEWRTVNVWRYDARPPAGTITVSGGEVVPTLPIVLNLSATDDHSGATEMRLSSDGVTWGEWEPYAPNRGWQLADVDGPQTIYAQFRDAAGNVSAAVSTSVARNLITAPPASTSYRIVRSVMGMGGGAKSSTNYRLLGTSGQAIQPSTRQTASYRLSSGYWVAAADTRNSPPTAPATPNPASGATNVAVTTALSWSATDPNGDALTYAVRFGTANPPPQVINSQSGTSYDPPGNLSTGTPYYWQIVASDGKGGATDSPVWSFTTAGQPAPTISSFNPTSGPAGTTVTITGSKFTGATNVTFNGTGALFNVVSDAQITTVVPAGAKTGKIAVTTSGGTVTTTFNFTVGKPPKPTVTGFSVAAALSGETITINGTNFNGATKVTFSKGKVAIPTVLSDNQIQVVVPAGAVTGKVSVTTAGGTGTSKGNFTVIVAPTVSKFAKTSGKVGDKVTITGKNFVVGATTVEFGTITATNVTVDSTTKITVYVPAGLTPGAKVKITVTNAAGPGVGKGDFLVK